MHVCVMGAGIVGLATAWRLRQDGHEVTVIDAGRPGHGTSGGNGAQLSYAYVQPLADPGIWAQLPKLLLSPTSPFKLRPRLDPRQWLWGLQFLAACNARTSRDTTVKLLALADESRVAFNALRSAEPLDCDFSATGKLVLYPTSDSFAGAQKQLALQRALGSTQEAVGADRCIELEPALHSRHAHIAGAIYTPGECAADCLKTCEALVALLRQRGVRFMLDTPIRRIVVRAGEVAAVATPHGELSADRYVMALGNGSARLASPLGVRLPAYPLKGYSITVDVDGAPGAAPRVSVTDSARKVVFARLGERLRVAGMAELTGYDHRIPPAQIASLRASTEAIFPGCSRFAELHPWTGMRPATPTGLPIIGRHEAAPGRLLFNTGHGALGFTLAFGSAGRIGRLLASGG